MKERRGGMTRSARVSIFVNVVLICALGTLLALAIIWLVGRLAWKNDLRVDLTSDDRFSVDPLAEKVLRDLNAPIRVTFVYGIDDEIRARALDLAGQPRADILERHFRPLLIMAAARVGVILTEWSKLSELFTFDMIDADVDPQRLTDVAQRQRKTAADVVRGVNQVVFEMGPTRRTVPMGRMFSIDWGFFSPDPRGGFSKPPEMIGKARVQSELTETLRALAAGETLKIGLPEGNSSAIPFSGRDFERLRDFFVSQGFDPAPFNLAKGVPSDVGLVAIIGMGRQLLPDEARELKRYEGAGGRLLLLADPSKPEDFASLLEPFGVKIKPALLEDPRNAAPRQTNPSVIFSDALCVGNHEIDRPVAGRIGVYVGVTRPLEIENLQQEGAERVPLLRGSNEAKVIPIEYRTQTGEPDYLNDAKKSAPNVPIAAALKRPTSASKESRIVVFGGWEIVSPSKIDFGTHFGNRDLVLNALNWIADRKGAIGIVERELASSRVELTPGFFSSFGWITMAGLPALLGLGGLAVWLRRRN